MMNWNNGWSLETWLVMGFAMVLFWSLIVTVVFAVVRWTRRGPDPTPPVDDARCILDRRFAHGEITDDEYTHQRHLLRTF